MKSIYTRKHTGTMPFRGHPDWFAVHQVVRLDEIHRAGLEPWSSVPLATGESPEPAPWEDEGARASAPVGADRAGAIGPRHDPGTPRRGGTSRA